MPTDHPVIDADSDRETISFADTPPEKEDIAAIEDAIGDEETASQEPDSSFAATLIERVTALVDALTSGQADDEVRVALATDLLSGNIDIDIAEHSTGDIAVELAADSLTGNLDVDLAEQTSGALDVSGATVPTEQQTPIQLENSSATNIDPATEGTVDAIKTAAQALDDALASNATDELRISTPSPIDVSAAEVDVDLTSQTLGAVTITDNGAFTLAANNGVDIGDVGIEDISKVTGQAAKSASVPVTLPSDRDTPRGLHDPSKSDVSEETLVDLRASEKGDLSIAPLYHAEDSVEARLSAKAGQTTSTGSANAAEIIASGGRTTVSVGWDVSGAATITIEVSESGDTWFDRTHDTISSQPGSSEKKAITFQTGFRHVRAHADSNLNELQISAKGL